MVGLGNHEFELVVSHSLPQFLCDPLQVFESDGLLVFESEELEGPLDLFLRLFFVHLRSHDLQELCIIYRIRVFFVLLLSVDL